MLLRMEFIGFVFELFLILGNEFLYVRLLRIFGKFADIVSLVQMLNIAPYNTITTFQPVLASYLFI